MEPTVGVALLLICTGLLAFPPSPGAFVLAALLE